MRSCKQLYGIMTECWKNDCQKPSTNTAWEVITCLLLGSLRVLIQHCTLALPRISAGPPKAFTLVNLSMHSLPTLRNHSIPVMTGLYLCPELHTTIPSRNDRTVGGLPHPQDRFLNMLLSQISLPVKLPRLRWPILLFLSNSLMRPNPLARRLPPTPTHHSI